MWILDITQHYRLPQLFTGIALFLLNIQEENNLNIYLCQLRHWATNQKVAGSITDEVNFYIYLILPVALGPGVYSASNRNEYQKH
jgi:hypothetical protein